MYTRAREIAIYMIADKTSSDSIHASQQLSAPEDSTDDPLFLIHTKTSRKPWGRQLNHCNLSEEVASSVTSQLVI